MIKLHWRDNYPELYNSTALHEVAEQGLRNIGGVNINTWTVSSTPAGVVKYGAKGEVVGPTSEGSTTEFLLKSHIIAGKFDLQKNDNVKEYKWLSKDEIKELVNGEYFEQVGHLLAKV
ncbi:unnamed protein product [Ambrosiozyma monospora]|uniref:Unnamed protein product n=1 Tax=Ambrosiozyma monospora TaxID=43982 RepID=A0ACB5UBZ1_AMBMO|nr:unnamed protein product [Ambrosiozyma monospora]